MLACQAGADFVGVILDHPPSPRHVALDEAPRHFEGVLDGGDAALVAVSVNRPLEWHERARQVLEGLTPRLIVQLHGDEEPALVRELKKSGFEVWAAVGEPGEAGRARALAMLEAGADAVLIDARAHNADGVVYGGTGRRGDWGLAAKLVDEGARVVLAGGLNPENVRQAIQEVRPWALDCLSGVEARKGVKDAALVRRFVQQAAAPEVD